MESAYICDALRTPFGRYGGSLAGVRPDDLAAVTLRAIVARNPTLDPAAIEDVILGCANQAGEDNRNVARMALLLAGMPHEVPGPTVNRLCGSSMEAVAIAASALRSGEMSPERRALWFVHHVHRSGTRHRDDHRTGLKGIQVIELRPVADLIVLVGNAVEIGATYAGARCMVPTLGGQVSGPRKRAASGLGAPTSRSFGMTASSNSAPATSLNPRMAHGSSSRTPDFATVRPKPWTGWPAESKWIPQ